MDDDLELTLEQKMDYFGLRNTQEAHVSLNYVQQATANNTRQAYCSDIRHFLLWGGKLPTDTATVISYCEAHATTLNPRTLKRRLVALKQFHRYQGFSDPTDHPLVSKTLRGIFNTHGKPKHQAPPMLFEHLKVLLTHLRTLDTLTAYRDAAMIALGFFAALRGRELVSLKAENIIIHPEGLVVHISRSKTDPSGEGQSCVIPRQNADFCPIKLLKLWQSKSNINSGYLFVGINQWQQLSVKPLSLQRLNQILRDRANEIALPQACDFSSHSLRRGFATSASMAGASFKSIMAQGRWRHEGTVLEYIEAGQQFNDSAVSKLFETN